MNNVCNQSCVAYNQINMEYCLFIPNLYTKTTKKPTLIESVFLNKKNKKNTNKKKKETKTRNIQLS